MNQNCIHCHPRTGCFCCVVVFAFPVFRGYSHRQWPDVVEVKEGIGEFMSSWFISEDYWDCMTYSDFGFSGLDCHIIAWYLFILVFWNFCCGGDVVDLRSDASNFLCDRFGKLGKRSANCWICVVWHTSLAHTVIVGIFESRQLGIATLPSTSSYVEMDNVVAESQKNELSHLRSISHAQEFVHQRGGIVVARSSSIKEWK